MRMASPLGEALDCGDATPGSEVTLNEDAPSRFPIKTLDMVVKDGGSNFSAGKQALNFRLAEQRLILTDAI